MRQIIKQEKAQNLVEAAIAIPILLIIFFGCVELVHLAIAHIMVKEAAYEAGRQAAIHQDNTHQAETVAASICEKISGGKTRFFIKDADNSGPKQYVVSHKKTALFPIIPDQEIKHSVAAFVFHTGD